MKKFKRIFTGVCFCMLVINGYAQLKVAQIFSDNMVLQRNEPINIWGWSDPGDKISVDFNKSSKEMMADKDGAWKVSFESLPAGGPYSISIQSKDN